MPCLPLPHVVAIMPPMPRHPLNACLDVAARVAQQAGRLQAKYAGRPKTIDTKRSAIDLVTEVDRASEKMIHRAIMARFPDHGFQGEEATRTNPDSPYRWIVDPLDGTTNFVHGMPMFGVSIGLRYHDELLVGVIYDPMRRELFTAMKGSGARLNGKRIRVSRTNSMATSLLSTGFSLAFRKTPQMYLEWLTRFEAATHAVRRMGSTAMSLAYLASGRQDGFYEKDLWPWDIAAGILLVREAGGRVTDFDGVEARVGTEQSRLVASNGLIHGDMLKILNSSSKQLRC